MHAALCISSNSEDIPQLPSNSASITTPCHTSLVGYHRSGYAIWRTTGSMTEVVDLCDRSASADFPVCRGNLAVAGRGTGMEIERIPSYLD
jgi:hypothetical protein